MTTANKLKILKIIKIAVFIVFVPILLFYLGIIVPEYLACDKTMYEGQKGIDIWGSEIDCDCESMEFSKEFFQMFSIVVGIFFVGISLLTYYYSKFKKAN